MRRTPDAVSKERQKLAEEIKAWRGKIVEVEKSLGLMPVDAETRAERVEYCRTQIAEAMRRMSKLRAKGKKGFWRVG